MDLSKAVKKICKKISVFKSTKHFTAGKESVIPVEKIKSIYILYFQVRMNEPGYMKPEDIADNYYAIAHQNKTAWTHETDMRPYTENW